MTESQALPAHTDRPLTYAERKNRGLCTRCGAVVVPGGKGKRRCHECKVQDRERQKAAYQNRKTADPGARLMSLRDLAGYLRVSYSAARQLVIDGHLPRVSLPPSVRSEGRHTTRILVDRLDVDALISKCRETIR